ncbi:hypothetical protein FIU94_09260 [Sulfitobacter sp. THAF37]|uniref:hypothetical protein n=1 Tax=Sulfitobacter sp. THAF37 TaxID=2587855 RepID=UPI00126866D7|nr:hypothetical protein [Sulfitobacter sp. THAF37]QFT59014.1 hypothetical protein FIU94_09260 [Sulfitobacter sp. THAF37]
MDIVLGLSVASVTVLLFCWAYGAHRRAVPARWTAWPGASMLTCVALTMLAPLSLGLFVRAAFAPGRVIGTFDWAPALVCIALMALAAIIGPVLFRSARRSPQAVALNTASPAPFTATAV